jgi:DNA-binding NarL/FixJ family response regulator
MEGSAPIRVVILYVHPLLGEGLARLLAAEPGVAACAISIDDPTGTAAALGTAPDVVIVERRERGAPVRLARDATVPLLLTVDIAGAGGTDHALSGTRPGPIHSVTDDLERVVRAVRELKHRRSALVTA